MSYIKQSEQKGVRLNSKEGKWVVSIYVCGREHYLGYFQTEKEAIQARQQAERNRDQFLKPPPRERKRRFNPFRLVNEEQFFANYQSLFAHYRGRHARDAALERMEDATDSFNDDVEDAREMLRLKHSGAFPVR